MYHQREDRSVHTLNYTHITYTAFGWQKVVCSLIVEENLHGANKDIEIAYRYLIVLLVVMDEVCGTIDPKANLTNLFDTIIFVIKSQLTVSDNDGYVHACIIKSMVYFWKILFMHASETVTLVKKKKAGRHNTGQTHSFRLLRQRNAALLNHLHLCTVIRFNEPVITGNFLAECNGLLFKPLPLSTTGRQVQYANQLTQLD
ncbi:hypothetical protein T11_5716 [Trichinella zimbabwensis]|uniref:Uncharacterized protein n=1 Tax=Trichinella zimbabwensis TaxID=268475 RepID=A0A0V1H3M8_9BILA|nr:hypothetical protein T11_5716 [Trichinella zimbabwensis]